MSDHDPRTAPDPTLGAEIEKAIRPFRAVVPPDAAAEVKARLAALSAHPVAATILAQLDVDPRDRDR